MRTLIIGLLLSGSRLVLAQPILPATFSMKKANDTISRINSGPEITTKKTNPVSLFAKTNPPVSLKEKTPAPEQR